MPSYPGAGQATLINYNQQVYLWQNETIAANGQSIAVQLRRIEGNSYPWGCAFEVVFSGAPGAFELDIMAAETDTANNYLKVGSITAVNASNVGRLDLTSATPFFGKFVCGFMKTLTNAVNTTLLVTR